MENILLLEYQTKVKKIKRNIKQRKYWLNAFKVNCNDQSKVKNKNASKESYRESFRSVTLIDRW